MRMRSSNPAVKRALEQHAGQAQGAGYQQGHPQQSYPQQGYPAAPPQVGTAPMTIDDVVVRTGMSLGVVVLLAVVNYFTYMSSPGLAMGLTLVGALGGLVLGLVIAFKNMTNPVAILAYSALEGLLVGGISAVLAMSVAPGGDGTLITQAVVATVAVFGVMLALYKFRIIKVTDGFVKAVTYAALAAGALILVNFLASFFLPGGLGLREPSFLGLGIGLVFVVIAALTLAIEFRGIEEGIQAGVPNQFAWQFAFGLTVSLVWLYIEILRLLWMLKMMFDE
ncbi:Bax inhibitor-1/YccA family protein [Nocardiopsis xinjiangensis]|uniref:Bax inhibitor-1/YccA family protein n=1 Tax=Nocardiopsis xinjiangensis TaxID=124285 RepID=UPI000477B784|nr:Bax inhibitor-1/YccA family protein [Nocardiopsis xinjiangensis]